MIDYKIGDIVKMKKNHACGGNSWKIIRLGMDIKLECQNCKHIVMLSRRKFEKNLKGIINEE